MTTIPTSGIYRAVIQGFYGNLTDSGKNLLWQQFLAQEGLTPQTINPNSLTTEQDFVDFIQNNIHTSGPSALSPDEIQKRTAMLAAFNLALKMLSTLQNSVIVQSNNLAFYTDWENEYTKMMAATPSYVANPTTGISRPATDPTKYDPSTFTFGYDNISVQQIADFIGNSVLANGSGSYILNSQSPSMQLTFSSDASGIGPQGNQTPTLTFTAPPGFTWPTAMQPILTSMAANNNFYLDSNVDGTGLSLRGFIDTTTGSPTFGRTVFTLTDTGGSQLLGIPAANVSSDLTSMFQTFYYSVLGNPLTTNDPGAPSTANPPTVYDPNSLPNIPWKSGLLGSSGTPDPIKLRAEINTELQQFIENIRSYRQAVQDTATNVQTNLSSTNQAINQQENLLSSIVTTMQTIIGTMFQ